MNCTWYFFWSTILFCSYVFIKILLQLYFFVFVVLSSQLLSFHHIYIYIYIYIYIDMYIYIRPKEEIYYKSIMEVPLTLLVSIDRLAIRIGVIFWNFC